MIKLRTQKVEIDLPTEVSEVWVRAVLQEVMKDPETYDSGQMVDRVGFVYRRESDFIMDFISVTDPVTQQPITASGAGIALLVKHIILKWIHEDKGGTVNEHGDLIIEGSL